MPAGRLEDSVTKAELEVAGGNFPDRRPGHIPLTSTPLDAFDVQFKTHAVPKLLYQEQLVDEVMTRRPLDARCVNLQLASWV